MWVGSVPAGNRDLVAIVIVSWLMTDLFHGMYPQPTCISG